MHIKYQYASLKTQVTMLFFLRTLPDHKVDDIGLPAVEVFLDVSGITYDHTNTSSSPDFGWLLPNFLSFPMLGRAPSASRPPLHFTRRHLSSSHLWSQTSSNKQGYDHQIRCDIETQKLGGILAVQPIMVWAYWVSTTFLLGHVSRMIATCVKRAYLMDFRSERNGTF